MTLFMDVHTVDGGLAADDVAEAHAADLATQDAYGVKYLRSWVNEEEGKVFCLVEADSADDAIAVHREAHGLVADEIYPAKTLADPRWNHRELPTDHGLTDTGGGLLEILLDIGR